MVSNVNMEAAAGMGRRNLLKAGLLAGLGVAAAPALAAGGGGASGGGAGVAGGGWGGAPPCGRVRGV